MKRICTKCIVAALILSMGITAGIPAYAAQPQTTAATEQAAQLSLEETASQYFENYPSDKHVVSAEQLLNRVEEGESFCLLDIRSAEDYAKGHIQGAVNIPYGVDVADALEIIPNDQPVLVYCYSGQTASQTVAIARMMGLDAYNLSGGMGAKGGSGWLGAGYHVVKYSTQQFLNAKVDRYFKNLPGNKNQLSAAAFLAAVEDKEDAVILDIRSAEDYAKGHIRGAINVPYGMDVAASLEKIPSDKTVYVYCYSGQTASQTALLLNLAGKKALNVSGGFNNGISKQEAVEKWMTTEPASFDDKTYAVDADIKAAVENYYKQVEKAEYAKNNISPKQLKQLMASGEEVFIADLRSEEDYSKGHIEGAVSLPYGKGMQEKFDILPTDQTIYVYCYSGQTASQTMAALRLKGYTVYNLSGGMGAEGGSGWLGAGYEVTAR